MNPSRNPRRLTYVLLFVLAGFVAIGVPMIPLGLAANSLPFPDLLYAVMAGWIIRRPDTVSLPVVAFLALLADALLMRPLGLWALMLVLGSEVLRLGHKTLRDVPFVLEWFYVGVLFAGLLLAQNILLLVSFSHMYPLGLLAGHLVRTVAIYPLVVAVLYWVVRVRAPRKDRRPNRVGVVI